MAEPNVDFIAVAVGCWHSFGLESNSTIVAWGRNNYGQCDAPVANEGFVAMATGRDYSLGLKSSSTTVEESRPGDVPGALMLQVCSLAPNPFNSLTRVSFETRGSGHVTMEVYDVSGRLVRTVSLGYAGSSQHWAHWGARDASGVNLASGVYFVRLRGTEGDSRAAKAVLVR